MRKPRPCGVLGCECACHRATVRRVPQLFTPEMDAVLRDGLASGQTVPMVAARLRVHEKSVRWRARTLGISLRDGWRSPSEIATMLGVSWRVVARWKADGLLAFEPHGRRWWRCRAADLVAFVAERAGLDVDPRAVRDRRLRSVAEISALARGRASR